ncbi:MAG TPA: hypothetical protein PL042_01755 [Caldisericia bacterium]|nr:hypothetical protein [Caldisericia bacterium]
MVIETTIVKGVMVETMKYKKLTKKEYKAMYKEYNKSKSLTQEAICKAWGISRSAFNYNKNKMEE